MPRRSADWNNTENRIRHAIEDDRTDKGNADDDDAKVILENESVPEMCETYPSHQMLLNMMMVLRTS